MKPNGRAFGNTNKWACHKPSSVELTMKGGHSTALFYRERVEFRISGRQREMPRFQGFGLHVPRYDLGADDNAFRREMRYMVLSRLVSNPGTKCNTSYFTRPRKKSRERVVFTRGPLLSRNLKDRQAGIRVQQILLICTLKDRL